jgi:hypothetical protein
MYACSTHVIDAIPAHLQVCFQHQCWGKDTGRQEKKRKAVLFENQLRGSNPVRISFDKTGKCIGDTDRHEGNTDQHDKHQGQVKNRRCDKLNHDGTFLR